MSEPGAAPTDVQRLVIAVLTYKRPDDLAAVLPELVEQARAGEALDLQVRVQVVDNDPAGSARDTVEAFAAAHPAEATDGRAGFTGVDYAHESVPGIAAARSRALTEAGQDDWLVFIDDDERPSEQWLAGMVTTARTCGAAAVAGPVLSVLAPDADPWIVEGGFFDRRHRWGVATGTDLDEAATNNLLLDMRFVRAHQITFATHLGLTGGEDSLFTRAVVRGGGRLVWCAEAHVSEPVPAQRAARRWVLMRGLSYGNAASLVALSEHDSPRVRAGLVAGGVARAAGGLARSARASLPGRETDVFAQAQGLRTAMRGVGMALGGLGLAWSEYARDGKHLVKATTRA